jgi:hypothetical protein
MTQRTPTRGTAMNIADIKELAQVRGNPAVSILCRLDRRRPGNLEDPRRLDAFRKKAIDTVLRTHDEREVGPLLQRIEAAVDSIDLAHPSDAIAILVTADESHVLTLPFPVFSRVVVDDTFATRDLVNGVEQMLSARVLVLAADRARCFEMTGDSLREVYGHGFPLHISPSVQEDTPHRDLPIGEHEQMEAHQYVLRAVDAGLAELQTRDHRPIVVVATVRELAYFDEVTRFAKDVIGRVHGNHVDDTVTGIEHVVQPTLTAELARRSDDAVRRANEAVGRGAATRFAKVAAAARTGRGRELIVEEDFHVETATTEGPDDPVDEVIQAVLTHDGQVTTVPPGALADHGGIVLILRY